jgi:hypothetical protein
MTLPSLRVAAVAAINITFVALLATDVHACACCTDEGEYELTTNTPVNEAKRALIEGLQFDSNAQLYLTDAGEDGVKGLSSISPTNNVTLVREAKQWRFTFRTQNDQIGTLTLSIPANMDAFATDLHDSEDKGLGPTLFKEWRLQGSAKGDGIFQRGFAAPARFRVIFQGRGNRCDSEADFTHWRLQIFGRKASYAFFGKLVTEGEAPAVSP